MRFIYYLIVFVVIGCNTPEDNYSCSHIKNISSDFKIDNISQLCNDLETLSNDSVNFFIHVSDKSVLGISDIERITYLFRKESNTRLNLRYAVVFIYGEDSDLSFNINYSEFFKAHKFLRWRSENGRLIYNSLKKANALSINFNPVVQQMKKYPR